VTPTVAVVVPTRNRRHLLALTLRSVLDQRGVDIEVLVVDEGSSDGTADLVRSLGDDRVRLLRNDEPTGVSAARNRGIGAARAPWVAFVDDDDLWGPDKLRAQLGAVTAEPGARWACSGTVLVDGNLRVIGQQRTVFTGDVSERLLVANVVPGGGSGVLVATDLAKEVGGFDPDLSNMADYDMWVRLALAAPAAGAMDRPHLAYRVHEGAMSFDPDLVYDERRRIDDKHAYTRAERGLDADWASLHVWAGDRHQRAGRRLPGAVAYLRSVRTPSRWRFGVRAAEALLAPRAHRRRDDRRRRDVSADWMAEAEAWLAPLRHLAADTSSTPPRSAGPSPR
jgi:glycosyltransferase involved in cell wall biosynthesis